MNFITLEPAASLALLDGLSCVLLAAAASARARLAGTQFMPALVLGAICGLIAPFAREISLGGTARGVFLSMPDCALAGALGGMAALMLMPRQGQRIFFWMDAAGCGLAACFATSVAVSEFGLTGALVLGLVCGLSPGIARDISLGDMALALEENWYASGVALAAMLTLFLLFISIETAGNFLQNPVYGIVCGCAFFCILRGLKGKLL